MPYVNTDYIKYMMKRIVETSYEKDAVITKSGDWIEPFNAFYSKELLPLVEDNIIKGKRGISELLDRSNVLYIDEYVARGFSPNWNMFTNLNTKKDLMEITALLANKSED